MELGWSALALICIAAALAWFWQDSLAAREQANAAATEACRRLSLQFLDGTVAFARLRFTREAGWLTLQRTYVFDYTANSIERRQGFVVLTGRRVDSVGYAPDARPPAQSARRPEYEPPVADRQAAPGAAPGEDSNIISLEDFRGRNRESGERREASDSQQGGEGSW